MSHVLRLQHFPYISAVPPEVTLIQTEKGTAVCKAAAGKPAAQISWTPEGDCVTEQDPYWGDGTVTVQSTCRWGGPPCAERVLLCLPLGWQQESVHTTESRLVIFLVLFLIFPFFQRSYLKKEKGVYKEISFKDVLSTLHFISVSSSK